MSTIHRITPDCQPVFPCWLWCPASPGYNNIPVPAYWYRIESVERAQYDRTFDSQPTHWHPDQPSAPTATPTPPESGRCPNDTDGDGNCQHCYKDGLCFYQEKSSAPPAAPAQGETPRTDAHLVVPFTDGRMRKPSACVLPEDEHYVSANLARQLERELNEAKAEVARITGESTCHFMDIESAIGKGRLLGGWHTATAEIESLRQSVARLTEERDQARQDLEERCAENDRERAAHLQAYQEACRSGANQGEALIPTKLYLNGQNKAYCLVYYTFRGSPTNTPTQH